MRKIHGVDVAIDTSMQAVGEVSSQASVFPPVFNQAFNLPPIQDMLSGAPAGMGAMTSPNSVSQVSD